MTRAGVAMFAVATSLGALVAVVRWLNYQMSPQPAWKR